MSDQPRLSRRRPRSEGQFGLMLIRRALLDVRQNPRNHFRLLDAGNHLELPATTTTGIDLDTEYALQVSAAI